MVLQDSGRRSDVTFLVQTFWTPPCRAEPNLVQNKDVTFLELPRVLSWNFGRYVPGAEPKLVLVARDQPCPRRRRMNQNSHHVVPEPIRTTKSTT